MVKAAQKNADHFAPLYERYHHPVFVFIWRRVQDEALAADLAANVFLKAMLNLKRYKFRNLPFSSWLFRIAVNETNMYFRKAKRQRSVAIDPEDLQHVAQESELDEQEANLGLMVEAMNELPEDQAQLIELRFFEKCSFKELGSILGVEEATAKMRVYRVLKRLKKMITLKGGSAQ